MADFLSYGTTKGLAKTVDWGSMIDQRLRNEQLTMQTKEMAANRAKEYAEKMSPYETEIGWLTEGLNKHNDTVRKKISTFLKENGDSWRYTVEGQMQFNALTKEFLDNDLVKIDKTSKQNWEQFKKSMDKMSPDHIRREQQKYQAFVENENEDGKPYIFDPTPTSDVNGLFDMAAESAGITTGEEGFTSISEVTDENLSVIANSYLAQYEYEFRDTWESLGNKELYGNNILTWVKKSIKVRTDRVEKTDWTGISQTTRAANAGKTAGGYNYYQQEVHPSAKTLVTGEGVPNSWVVFTNSSYEDGALTPDKAVLYDPTEMYTVIDGKLTPVGDVYDFDKVGIASMGDVFIDPNAGPNDPYKEYVRVEVLAEKNHGEGSDYFTDTKSFNETIRLSDADPKKSGNINISTGSFPTFGSGEDREDSKNKPKKYRAFVYLPIDRNSQTNAMRYNQVRGGDDNARKAVGVDSGSGEYVEWKDVE